MIFGLISEVLGIADKKIADADTKIAFKAELEKLVAGLPQEQLSVNRQEAAHRSIFVAGWRPFIGWSCGVAFAYTYFLRDLIIFLATVFAPEIDLSQLPEPNLVGMMPVLMGMLGLGGLRSWEKSKGIAK